MPNDNSHPGLMIHGPNPGPWQACSSNVSSAGKHCTIFASVRGGSGWRWLESENLLREGRLQHLRSLDACHKDPCIKDIVSWWEHGVEVGNRSKTLRPLKTDHSRLANLGIVHVDIYFQRQLVSLKLILSQRMNQGGSPESQASSAQAGARHVSFGRDDPVHVSNT